MTTKAKDGSSEWTKIFKDNLCVEVTIKRVYIIDHGLNGWTDEQVVDEWFKKYPIHKYHASRDACRLGGADTVTHVRILKPGDVPEIEKDLT